MGAALSAPDQHGRTSWVLWGRATTNISSLVLKLKERIQKKTGGCTNMNRTNLGGCFSTSNIPQEGIPRKKSEILDWGKLLKENI